MLVGLSSFLPELTLTAFDNLEFLIRILLSGVLGACIGLERTKRQKEAGVRTHCIVAVTSAVFMILSKYAFMDLLDITAASGAKDADPSRIASQVVTGISFLGAGVIFRNGNLSIKGLTTAAGLWATSSVGMAIGAGLYWVGCLSTAVLMGVQILLHHRPVGRDADVYQEIKVQMKDDLALMGEFDQLVENHRGCIVDSEIVREDGRIGIKTVIRLKEQISHQEACAFLEKHQDIYQISI